MQKGVDDRKGRPYVSKKSGSPNRTAAYAYEILSHGAEGNLADQAHQGQQEDAGEAQGHPLAAPLHPLVGQVQIDIAQSGADNSHKGKQTLQKAEAAGGGQKIQNKYTGIADEYPGHNKVQLTVTILALSHS